MPMPLVAFAAMFAFAVATSEAQSGSGDGGCAALLKAAQKGYRGDPVALEDCRRRVRARAAFNNAGFASQRRHRQSIEAEARKAAETGMLLLEALRSGRRGGGYGHGH